MSSLRMQTAPQGGGRQLAIEGAVTGGESTEISKAVSSCDLGDGGGVRSPAQQGAVELLHCAEATIAGRAYTQVRLAALAQHSPRNAERRADLGHVQGRFGNEQILKPGENAAMAAGRRGFIVRQPH